MGAELATHLNTTGLCHTCGCVAPLSYDQRTEHWICQFCRSRFASMGRGFMVAITRSSNPRRQCCGPGVEVRSA